MPIAKMLLPEWENEMRNTRRALERVPADRLDFRPHELSWTLGELATHVAYLPRWVTVALTTDELDLADTPPNRAVGSTDELLAAFEANIAKGTEALSSSSDETFGSPWTLRKDGHVVFTMPKAAVIRSFVMNHIIHHRGQLTIYLRLVGAKVPGLYGPSADEV
jgi:uncharacterized damage-inducible protein DinB